MAMRHQTPSPDRDGEDQHGGDEAATVKLFKDGGVRVIPGSYLARQQADGSNPGAGYIRVAMVQDSESTAEALHRMVEVLNSSRGQ